MADKKRTEPDWQDIRVFLALGRHGSLSAAARVLAVNHATIARRLHSLEATLGEKLVERRPEGYVLTPAGTRTLSAASDMETAVQTLRRGGTDDSPKGLVRVNVPPALSVGFLTGRLAEIPMQYPGLDIDLAAELRLVSLERREADIVVRLGRPPDGDFLAKPLVTVGYGFYGTPSICRHVEDGAEPVFVGFDEINAYVPEAIWLARHFSQARLLFRVNNQFAQGSAAKSGAGLALLPHYIGRAEHGLRLCRLGPVLPPREMWLLTRRHDRKQLAISTVVGHLVQIFAKERALFETTAV
jgi:DNA-binding transcriptional LysR family regulator